MSAFARPVPASPPEAGLLRPEEVGGILKPLDEARPLPARIYAGPEVYAAEQARILRRERLPTILGLPESGYRQVDFIGIFPCLHISLQHDSMTAYPIFPHRQDRITYSWLHHMPPGSPGQPGFEDYIEAQGNMIEEIQGEDNGALIHIQKGWASTGAAPTFLSHLEATTWQFQRWYAERMRC